MERRKIVAVFFISALVMASAAFSKNRVASAEIKIGIVDLQKGLEESEAGKEAYKALKAEYNEKQDKIKKKEEALRKLRAELDGKGSVLKDSVKKEREEDYQNMLRDLRRLVSDSNQEMQRKERDLSIRIISELMEIAKKIGQEEGYTLIIERREGVIFSSASINLTDKVVERYDKIKKTSGR